MRRLLYLHWSVYLPLLKSSCPYTYKSLSELYTLFYWSIFCFAPILQCNFDITVTLKEVLKSGNISPVMFFFKVVFNYSVLCISLWNLESICQFLKDPTGIFIGMTFESIDQFRESWHISNKSSVRINTIYLPNYSRSSSVSHSNVV